MEHFSPLDWRTPLHYNQGMMAVVNTPGWKCESCGYIWLKASGRTPPLRCANVKCKSRRWNDGNDDVRGTRGSSPGKTQRSRDNGAVPVLQEAKSGKKGREVHPVPSVWDQLATWRDAPPELPEPQPVEVPVRRSLPTAHHPRCRCYICCPK
jgi:hypothetical protein